MSTTSIFIFAFLIWWCDFCLINRDNSSRYMRIRAGYVLSQKQCILYFFYTILLFYFFIRQPSRLLIESFLFAWFAMYIPLFFYRPKERWTGGLRYADICALRLTQVTVGDQCPSVLVQSFMLHLDDQSVSYHQVVRFGEHGSHQITVCTKHGSFTFLCVIRQQRPTKMSCGFYQGRVISSDGEYLNCNGEVIVKIGEDDMLTIEVLWC